MNVCIDIQSAIAQRAGVGRYTRLLVEHLAPLAGPDRLSLFYFDFSRKGEPFPVPGAVQRAVRWVPGRYVQKAWKEIGFPPFNWFAGTADIYHFPNFVRPPLTRGKSVVTIHDVSFLRFPETMEEKNRRYLTRCMRDTVDRADAIITDCAFVADELRERMNVPADKLHPILLGMSRQIADAPAAAVAAFRKSRGLERPYLLHVGTIEPRKNHLFLLKVFERLRGFDGDLVLAGMRGWKCDPVFAAIEASPKRDRIRYLEYVSDDDLPALYTGAEALLFPSLYEGFGFPPLEAMSCGTPVVSSTAGSLAEVLGGGARLIAGYDESEWTQAVELLLGGTEARTALTAAGRAKAAEYNWDRTAAQTWNLYRKLGNSSGGGGISAAGNP